MLVSMLHLPMVHTKKQIQAENEVYEEKHGLARHFYKKFVKTFGRKTYTLAGEFRGKVSSDTRWSHLF